MGGSEFHDDFLTYNRHSITFELFDLFEYAFSTFSVYLMNIYKDTPAMWLSFLLWFFFANCNFKVNPLTNWLHLYLYKVYCLWDWLSFFISIEPFIEPSASDSQDIVVHLQLSRIWHTWLIFTSPLSIMYSKLSERLTSIQAGL